MSASDYTDLVTSAAARYNVPAPLVLGVIAVESGGDPNAIATAAGDIARGGSYGLMQMSLDTAQALGFAGTPQGLLDPATNIDLGTHYLSDLLGETGGNVDAAISGYNAGLSSVRPGDGQRVGNTGTDADLNTPFINQGYVDAVKAAMAQFSTAQIATGGALVLLAIGAGVWWTMSHRKRGAT